MKTEYQIYIIQKYDLWCGYLYYLTDKDEIRFEHWDKSASSVLAGLKEKLLNRTGITL